MRDLEQLSWEKGHALQAGHKATGEGVGVPGKTWTEFSLGRPRIDHHNPDLFRRRQRTTTSFGTKRLVNEQEKLVGWRLLTWSSTMLFPRETCVTRARLPPA